MGNADFILDVNETNFEFEVISYSQNTPVVVDFWAEWCRPCKTLGPILEKLAIEMNGAFRLARLDVDHNPNLAILYNVRSIPTVKAFSQGEIVSEFVGLLPENRIREFLEAITPPSTLNLTLEKANSLLLEHEWQTAAELFQEILEQDPDQPAALLGLAKCLLAVGRHQDALVILTSFPTSKEFKQSELLLPYARALSDYHANQLPDENELDAAFHNSIRLAQRGNILAALDGLLDILRQNRHYRSDKARLVFLSLLELLGDEDPQTRQYRAELASTLF
ncbi:MAG: thioredoxin [Chloroflexi bacterium]|nr:thioredoxin [Chloroflexota bacterium]